jgi:hypothetical protein
VPLDCARVQPADNTRKATLDDMSISASVASYYIRARRVLKTSRVHKYCVTPRGTSQTPGDTMSQPCAKRSHGNGCRPGAHTINLPHEHLLILELHVRVMRSTTFVSEREHVGICYELLYRDHSERNFVQRREMRPGDRARAPTQQTVASTRCRSLVKPVMPRHERKRPL